MLKLKVTFVRLSVEEILKTHGHPDLMYYSLWDHSLHLHRMTYSGEERVIFFFCIVLYRIVLYCIVLYCIVSYCIVLIINAADYFANSLALSAVSQASYCENVI